MYVPKLWIVDCGAPHPVTYANLQLQLHRSDIAPKAKDVGCGLQSPTSHTWSPQDWHIATALQWNDIAG